MSLTTTLQTDLLDRYFGNGSVVRIGLDTVSYLGLCTGDPGEAGSADNEVDFGNRLQLSSTDWNAPSGGDITSQKILSITATSSQALTHFLLSDINVVASTHDFGAPLVTTVNTSPGDSLRIDNGDIVVNITDLFTDYYSAHVLDMLLRNDSSSPVFVYYYALSTTTPNPNGTGFTEPVGGSYLRIAKTRASPFGSAVSGSPSTIQNSSSEIRWPLATGSWGTVTYWGIFDAASGGNLLCYGPLTSSVSVVAGIQALFAVNDLVITME